LIIKMSKWIPEHFIYATLYTRDKEPLFARREAKQLLLGKMQETKHQFMLIVAAYVVLDDHLHWLFATPPSNECSAIINHLRASTQRDWRKLEPGHDERPVWQHGFKHRLVTEKDDLRDHLDVIHYDPVYHGAVARAADYPWSSLPARVAEGHFADDWGVLAPPAAVAKIHGALAVHP